MFSCPGISVFFQPLRAAGAETIPAQAIAALHKAGEEQKKQQRPDDEREAPELPEADSAQVPAPKDQTHLSIEALRRLLAHTPADHKEGEENTPDASLPADKRDAFAAYHRAADAKPALKSMPEMEGFTPPPKERATAQDILLILAKLESAGIRDIKVRDGASVYDTICAMCWSLSRRE